LLQKASGNVRCSGCSAAFNALDYISEDPPAAEDAALQTSALLQTLDRLAGPNEVRIEDTGVEWQVHDDTLAEDIPLLVAEDVETVANTLGQGQLDLSDTHRAPPDLEEMRFDDSTPLPEDFAAEPGAKSPFDNSSTATAEDDSTPAAQDDRQEELELGETGDWEDLLDEVEEQAPRDEPATEDPGSEHQRPRSEAEDLPDDGSDAEVDSSAGDDVVHEADGGQDEKEAGEGVAAASIVLEETMDGVESIIMEGDTYVGDGGDSGVDAAEELEFGSKQGETTSYTLQRLRLLGGRRKTDPPGLAVVAGVILLALLLGGQFVHANRQYLSTFELFEHSAGPVYRLFGRPVTPRWDVRGWRFESTKGATDENDAVLTILSRIANGSDKRLPYPLLHVSLTDRWEEIIGSMILEPGSYLTGDADRARPVVPGEHFTAVISIASPAAEATGFKLNVCYRLSPGMLRCATDDFKR
jgi:hypothetical protein